MSGCILHACLRGDSLPCKPAPFAQPLTCCTLTLAYVIVTRALAVAVVGALLAALRVWLDRLGCLCPPLRARAGQEQRADLPLIVELRI